MQTLYKKLKVVFTMIDILALILLVVGGLNWGLVGIFEFDLVAFLFGGQTSFISRTVYILVFLSALWCLSFFMKKKSGIGRIDE